MNCTLRRMGIAAIAGCFALATVGQPVAAVPAVDWDVSGDATLVSPTTVVLDSGSGSGTMLQTQSLSVPYQAGDYIEYDYTHTCPATGGVGWPTVAVQANGHWYYSSDALIDSGTDCGVDGHLIWSIPESAVIQNVVIYRNDAHKDIQSSLANLNINGEHIYFRSSWDVPMLHSRVERTCGHYKARLFVRPLGEFQQDNPRSPHYQIRINRQLVAKGPVHPGQTRRFARDFREDVGPKHVVIRSGGKVLRSHVVRTNCRR